LRVKDDVVANTQESGEAAALDTRRKLSYVRLSQPEWPRYQVRELVFHLASGETLSKFIARAEKSIKESMCCRIVITIQTAPWGDDNWSGIPEAATP
jgi:hypothetical protein